MSGERMLRAGLTESGFFRACLRVKRFCMEED